jgi:uncharacterized protein YjhX (UPF0386 family)
VQARTRQLLAKLLLESTPLTVERDNKKRNISVRCFTFLVAPLMVERERERESKRSISTSHGREHVHSCIG